MMFMFMFMLIVKLQNVLRVIVKTEETLYKVYERKSDKWSLQKV